MEIKNVKALCICDSGNVRSGCLSRLIKALGGEAVSIGAICCSKNTIKLFSKWSNVVFDMSSNPEFIKSSIDETCLDELAAEKLIRIDIGPDRWWTSGSIYNVELIEICLGIIKEHIL